uniref:Uncharacterized protein n=1 Tax=Plectus sambesii TaxID=2011161 RepID=A0A914URD7_9BILA
MMAVAVGIVDNANRHGSDRGVVVRVVGESARKVDRRGAGELNLAPSPTWHLQRCVVELCRSTICGRRRRAAGRRVYYSPGVSVPGGVAPSRDAATIQRSPSGRESTKTGASIDPPASSAAWQMTSPSGRDRRETDGNNVPRNALPPGQRPTRPYPLLSLCSLRSVTDRPLNVGRSGGSLSGCMAFIGGELTEPT